MVTRTRLNVTLYLPCLVSFCYGTRLSKIINPAGTLNSPATKLSVTLTNSQPIGVYSIRPTLRLNAFKHSHISVFLNYVNDEEMVLTITE